MIIYYLLFPSERRAADEPALWTPRASRAPSVAGCDGVARRRNGRRPRECAGRLARRNGGFAAGVGATRRPHDYDRGRTARLDRSGATLDALPGGPIVAPPDGRGVAVRARPTAPRTGAYCVNSGSPSPAARKSARRGGSRVGDVAAVAVVDPPIPVPIDQGRRTEPTERRVGSATSGW